VQPPSSPAWPELPYLEWREMYATLHLWTQIVGKVRLALTPWLNHSWHVPLYVNARGLTTSLIPCAPRGLEIQFDFIAQELSVTTTDGGARRMPLVPMSVAQFHTDTLRMLSELDVAVTINDYPCEIAAALHFTRDRSLRNYDGHQARQLWRALVQVERVLQRFRTRFIGKCSPVHFFWGSFDLAVTRFSGRRAPDFAGKVPGVGPAIMREAYSHEVSSAGFWPGGPGAEYAAFYSYAYPTPAEFKHARIEPTAAFFSESLGEYLLPYDAVRAASDPDATLLAFLESTYAAAANTASWDRAALECSEGIPGRPRDIALQSHSPSVSTN